MLPRTSEDGDRERGVATVAAISNAILLGVPTTYLMTDSILVTGIAAAAAAIPAALYLARRVR